MEEIADIVETYKKKNYIVLKEFPEEYILMYNEETGKKVRIYYNGKVWDCE